MTSNHWTLLLLIAGPLVFAALAFLARGPKTRAACVTGGAGLAMVTGLWAATHGGFQITLPEVWGGVAFWIEMAILAIVAGIALRIRAWLILILALVQFGFTLSEDLLSRGHEAAASAGATFLLDPLSTILLLVVNVVGAVIVFYALGYMKQHHHHAPKTAASDGRFYFFLVGFLGFMNGLVLADSLRWLAIFWEATTLCSYMLIGHDGTPEARNNAKRALLINSFGGAAMALAALWNLHSTGTETLTGLMAAKAVIPMTFLCLAALTKSAQMPFQSWLLGAMVAPTPVSALLHAATMVKAGSYLILRLAPAFAGEKVMYIIAVAGAFTFASTALLAVGQSNAKKVLAYSTISNLGLIVACAGIDTPLAYAAALMILCFHAVSKGLLFLCVGAIEQAIGSRDIEDMGNIMFRLPLTAVVTFVGMISMLLPPFGMLLSKWMAIESAIDSPAIMILVIVGSALTVLFWAKWLGRIQTVSYHAKYKLEKMPPTMMSSLLALGGGVIMTAAFGIVIYQKWVAPLATAAYQNVSVSREAWALLASAGSFLTWPVFVLLGVALLVTVAVSFSVKSANVRPPFLCGENMENPLPSVDGGQTTYAFRTFKDGMESSWAATFYMQSVLHESRFTAWANMVAWLIILAIFGKIGVF